MLELKLNIDNRPLQKLARAYPATVRAVGLAKMTAIVLMMERAVKKTTPHGAGPIHLRDTIFGKTRTYGSNVAGFVGTPSPYGEPVESGTKPHFPPLDPLQHWVERKLGLDGDAARSVAFLIACKISHHGTEAVHMFKDAFEEYEHKITAMLDEIVDEVVARVG